MMQGLYTSSTGMQSHSLGMNVISQNIANVNTVGFKQQLLLFDSLGSNTLPAGAAYEMEMRQVGYGSSIGNIRTLHSKSGSFEPGNAETDLALSGKGFFQVSDAEGDLFYTRAGNFRFNEKGTLQTPTGHALMGIPIGADGNEAGGMEPININFNDPDIATDPPKATSQITAALNMYSDVNAYSNEDNPFFSMVQSWDGTKNPPLKSGTESVSLTYYDNTGEKHNLQVYIDPATTVDGQQVYEYVIAMDPELDAREGFAGTKGAGVLMAGTMTFSSAGELKNMSAFTPTNSDTSNLANWSLAELTNGVPSLNIQMKDKEPQTISLNLGIKSNGNGWDKGNMTADQVGKDFVNIPGMTNPELGNPNTTALKTSSSLKNLKQDGYAQGDLTNMFVDENGFVQLTYSNGQSKNVYRIPIARFTSEDGLYREGNNLYSQTPEAGEVEFGMAGTENYSSIHSRYLENSNVDMSREMVSMIMVQRGFQSNSKSLQSIDSMIQKAMEMKR